MCVNIIDTNADSKINTWAILSALFTIFQCWFYRKRMQFVVHFDGLIFNDFFDLFKNGVTLVKKDIL